MNELLPKQTWLQQRFEAVCSAIAGRYEKEQPIPIEWVEEYNELIPQVKTIKNTQDVSP